MSSVPVPEVARIFLSALGFLQSSGGTLEYGEIARRMFRKDYATGTFWNISQYRSIARSAAESFSLARTLSSPAGGEDVTGRYPIIPASRPEQGRYVYRVVVEVYSGSHVVASTAVTVYSDTVQTADELHTLAVGVVLQDRDLGTSEGRVAAALGLEHNTATYLISAGRTA